MRFADIDGAPKRCTLMKLYTNQGLVGYGEVRDASSRTYAAMLKSRILGENPCNVEKIFRRIKQFGGDSRQAGGVCAVELACWDLCGKAWGLPVWQLLGGKWRDEIRCYCDTDSEGGGRDMGAALKERMKMGFTFLKMDLGIELLTNVKNALVAPLGYLEYMRKMKHVVQTPHGSIDPRSMRGEATEHPYWHRPAPAPAINYLKSRGVAIHGHILIWGSAKPNWIYDWYCPEGEKRAFDAIGIPRSDTKDFPKTDNWDGGYNKYWRACWSRAYPSVSEAEIAAMAPTFVRRMPEIFRKRVFDVAREFGEVK